MRRETGPRKRFLGAAWSFRVQTFYPQEMGAKSPRPPGRFFQVRRLPSLSNMCGRERILSHSLITQVS